MASQADSDVYKELGATPIINAIGSITLLGGSTPPREVVEAMVRASSAYISLMELEEKAGIAIANMVDVPAAYITSGAGSALTLATAAAMAGDDDDKIEQLPDTSGMKNEILIQRRQRYWYDRCLQMAGGRLVEFGSEEKTTPEDLEKAIGPNTAAVCYVAMEQTPNPQALSGEKTIEIARAHGVPVIVDAASQIYPLDLLGKYVRMGADYECVAAKYLGAPNSTGIAMGTEESIRKLSLHSFAAYEGRRIRGVGRPHKVDRQEMIGVVAAIKRWVTMNHEDRLANIEGRCQSILTILNELPGVEAKMIDNVIGHQPFGVSMKVDSAITGMTVQDIVERLKEGDPSIWTRVRPEDTMIIHMFGLAEGEEQIVAEEIRKLLTG